MLPITTAAVRSAAEAAAAGPAGDARAEPPARRTLLELLPADAVILEESTGPDFAAVGRAWREAEHHLAVARKLGEDVPSRDAILEDPECWRRRIQGFARLLLREEPADLQLGFFPPERIDHRRATGARALALPVLTLRW